MRFLSVLAIWIYAVSSLSAQQTCSTFNWGLRAAGGYSNFGGEVNFNQRTIPAYSVGLSSFVHVYKKLGLESNLVVSKKGSTYQGIQEQSYDIMGLRYTDYYSFRETYDLYVLEFPLLLTLEQPFKQFSIRGGVGPNLGYNYFSGVSRMYDDAWYQEKYGFASKAPDLKGFEWGVVGSVGVQMPFLQKHLIGLDMRFTRSFSAVGVEELKGLRNRQITFGLNYWH